MNHLLSSPERGYQSESFQLSSISPCHKRRRLNIDTDNTSAPENDSMCCCSSHNALSCSITEPWIIHESNHQCCHIDDIPKEIFLKIISFIGPTSPTLLSLSQVNKHYAHLMKQVGEAIMVRAEVSYRTLLPKMNSDEPLLSICTRHVRCFQDIMKKCNTIKKILDKSFAKGCLDEALTRGYISQNSVQEVTTAMIERNLISATGTESSISSSTRETKNDSTSTSDPSHVKLSDIDQALNLALDLLGCDNINYFIENNANLPIPLEHVDPSFLTIGRKSILEFFKENIEHQILTLCGKCGGKVFKYCKMMKILQEHDRNNGIDDPSSFSSGIIQSYKDEERYDRSRLVMQLVVHRFLTIERSSLIAKATSSSISSSLSSTTSLTTTTTTTTTDSIHLVSATSPSTTMNEPNHCYSGEQHQGVSNDSKREDQKKDEGKSFYSWLES